MSEPKVQEAKEPKAFTTVFSVWNTMIGSSMLSLTWAFGHSGLVGGIAVVFAMLLVMWYSIKMIMWHRDRERFHRPSCPCACHTESDDHSASVNHSEDEAAAPVDEAAQVNEATSLLSEPSIPKCEEGEEPRKCCDCWRSERFTDFMYVCRDYLGEHGRWAAWAGSVITLTGAILVYDILVTTNLYSLVAGIYHRISGTTISSSSSSSISELDSSISESEADERLAKYWNPTLAPIYFALVFLPLCCMPRLQTYVRISGVGILGMLYVVGFIIVSSILRWQPATTPRDYGIKPHATYLAGIMCLAFFVHNFVLQVSALTRRRAAAVRNVTVGFCLGGVSYAAIGAITYAALGNGVPQDYLQYFAPTDIAAMTAKVALLFQLCTVLPFITALLRTQVFAALFGQKLAEHPPLLYTLLFNVLVLTVATLLSIFYPRVGDVIRFTGPTCAVLYVFLLPALVMLAHARRHHALTPLKIALHVLYVLLGVAILVFQFV